MAIFSSFPNGFPNGVSIRGLPIIQTHPGKVFWVDNSAPGNGDSYINGSNGNTGTFRAPFATLAYAISQCRSGKGDIIFIKPGHAENVSDATSLAFNKAGIAIIGLGTGTSRPTFTFDTANTATIAVSAADVTVQNILFVGNFLSIASVFTVGAAREFHVDNCEFRDSSSSLGFLTIVTTGSTANAANGLEFTNNRIRSDSTSATAAVIVAGTMDRLKISDNYIVHTGANNNVAVVLEHGALVVDRLEVFRNKVFSVNTDTATGAILVKTTATTGSGMIADNYVYGLDVAAAILVTAAAVQYGLFNNLWTGDTGTSGYVLPAIGTN